MQRAKTKELKISPEFSDKLDRLEPKEKVRIVLMLFKSEGEKDIRRKSRIERKNSMKSILESSKKAVPEIDKILKRYGGEKLASSPDVLGSIPVETTVAGVNALAQLKGVKAIVEDQPISLIS